MDGLKRLIGMPLGEAKASLGSQSEMVKVLLTTPPARDGVPFPTDGREPFVVGARQDTLIAAWFSVPDPRSKA